MQLLVKIKNGCVDVVKSALLKKIIKKQPVVIKDLQTSLLKGKHALITGGTSGIGYAIGKKMIESGATVTLVGRNKKKAEEYSKELGCNYLIIDVTETRAMISQLQDFLKTQNVDILINSAGIRDLEPWLAKTPEGFDKVINTNLKSVYFLC